MSDTPAYGLWSLVVINSLFFIAFAFSFARPRSKRDWRSFDAMTSDRPYRKGLSFEVAKAEILRMRGSQFDPVAVRLFLDEEPVLRRMVEMKCSEAVPG